MYVAVETITESYVFRRLGRWHRQSKSCDFGLRPTKGWLKLGRVKTHEEWTERHSIPRGWKRGFSRTITKSK